MKVHVVWPTVSANRLKNSFCGRLGRHFLSFLDCTDMLVPDFAVILRAQIIKVEQEAAEHPVPHTETMPHFLIGSNIQISALAEINFPKSLIQ